DRSRSSTLFPYTTLFRSAKDRVVAASDLRALLDEAIAFYHVEVHSGVNAQPARLWEKELRKWETIPVIHNDRQIDQIMGMVEERSEEHTSELQSRRDHVC